jgi:hypothetical protein
VRNARVAPRHFRREFGVSTGLKHEICLK